jgi:SagB-type dehydrogenase family enzyme
MLTRQPEDVNTFITTPPADSLAELYHENSKLRRINSRGYGQFVSSLTKIPNLTERMAHSYKVYPTAQTISLPQVQHEVCPSSPTLEATIQSRRTARSFTGGSLSLSSLSKLLHYSYGVTATSASPGLHSNEFCFRAAPSAGALYPLEVYFVTWKTSGLNPGIYHYCVPSHSLELLTTGNFADESTKHVLSEELAETAAGLFFVTALFQRTMLKYNERGYRFVLLEAGHLAENMCLMACAMQLGILPIGGFLDDEINRFLLLDGVNEAVVYTLAIGGIVS